MSSGGASDDGRMQTEYSLSGDAIFEKWKAEADGVLLWLARMPVDNIFPRQSVAAAAAAAAGEPSAARRPGEVLTAQLDEPLPDIFRKLVLEGFLSAPVVDPQGMYHGFIDMLDLVVYTLKIFAEWRSHAPGASASPASGAAAGSGGASPSAGNGGTGDEQVWSEFMKLNEFRTARVRDAMRNEANAYNPQHAIARGFSLFHAVELMARTMAHRVAVTNKGGVVTGILTQSMTISLLDQNMEARFPTISSVPVSILMPGLYKSVEFIGEHEPAIEAFKKMITHNVSGLPVVNAAGHLVDNISVRDLRGIGTDSSKWLRLWDSVRKYKDNVRAEFSSQTPDRPIFVTPDDTLATVLRRMYDGNIHRVYVANIGRAANGEMVPLAPLHVISQRDILRFVLFLTLRLRSVKRLTRWWRGEHTQWEENEEAPSGSADTANAEATIDMAQATSAQQLLDQAAAAEHGGASGDSQKPSA